MILSAWDNNAPAVLLNGKGIFTVEAAYDKYELVNFSNSSIYLTSPNASSSSMNSLYINPLDSLIIQKLED